MMEKTPLVSVIVPVYKVEKYLRTCVESVIRQTYKNWELILVDDGSPDKSGLICDEYASKDSRIQVVHKGNGGQAQARNRGLDLCKGDYVTFLDSDDFFHQDFICYMVEAALKNKADIVQCDYLHGVCSSFPKQSVTCKEKSYDNHSVFIRGGANVIVWGKLYVRNIVDNIRIKEGKYYEDDFTTWKWYYHANKIIVSDRKLYYYTDNPESTMAKHRKKPNFDFLEAYDERISFFVKSKEKDLEDCSRLQLCKILVLTYSNKLLSYDERKLIKKYFDVSWKVLMKSDYISSLYMNLFRLFSCFPLFTSITANRLHNIV